MSEFASYSGLIIWLLVILSVVGMLVFIERLLYYHREQINATEFLNGIRTVLRRKNLVEALAICDATPGPVPRLVKVAILNRERSKESIIRAIEHASLLEVPRLEQKLPILATIAQIAPLIGLLGTVLGLIDLFYALEQTTSPVANTAILSGIWKGLVSMAAGLAVAIPCYAGYNYLLGRVQSILLDIEKATIEIQDNIIEMLHSHQLNYEITQTS